MRKVIMVIVVGELLVHITLAGIAALCGRELITEKRTVRYSTVYVTPETVVDR